MTTSTIRVMTLPLEGAPEITELPKATLSDELHKIVGGYFQCVPLWDGVYLWVNEDGKGTGLPLNFPACALWSLAYGPTDYIVGNAVLTGGADRNGDTIGLSDEAIERLTKFYDLA